MTKKKRRSTKRDWQKIGAVAGVAGAVIAFFAFVVPLFPDPESDLEVPTSSATFSVNELLVETHVSESGQCKTRFSNASDFSTLSGISFVRYEDPNGVFGIDFPQDGFVVDDFNFEFSNPYKVYFYADREERSVSELLMRIYFYETDLEVTEENWVYYAHVSGGWEVGISLGPENMPGGLHAINGPYPQLLFTQTTCRMPHSRVFEFEGRNGLSKTFILIEEFDGVYVRLIISGPGKDMVDFENAIPFVVSSLTWDRDQVIEALEMYSN